METELLSTDTPGLLALAELRAVETLSRGELVALPTETVYGLAADALRPEAVVKIFEAKERPFFDPLICHLPSHEWLERMAEIPEESQVFVDALVQRFWPGPLTLVLPRRKIVPDVVTSGLETVALRMSAHSVFRQIVSRFGKPLSAPSANRFGRISPTAAAHVVTELGGRIPLVVDGGATAHGIESTIVAVESGKLRLLRAGPITPEDLGGVWMEICQARREIPSEQEVEAFFNRLGVSHGAMRAGSKEVAMEAPGQMKSHYAPRTPLRLIVRGTHVHFPGRIGQLVYRGAPDEGDFLHTEVLSPSGDLREAAATLFAKLRRLDEAGLDLIVAEAVPEHGLGIAIMDRLRKAAAGSTENY